MDIYVSRVTDGTMKVATEEDQEVTANQHNFLVGHSVRPEDTTLLRLLYGGNDYCRYATIDASYRGDGIVRSSTLDIDGLVVTETEHAILLPLADCIGAVLYDETQRILMVSHLGRHNLEQFGGTASVAYLIDSHDIKPEHLKVWLSPAAGAKNYPLFAFDNRSLHDVAIEQIMAGGVPRENIDVSAIDTTTNSEYFSHSEFLKGNREIDGRFAIVAVMRDK